VHEPGGEQALVGGADVVGVRAAHRLVGQGVDLEKHAPALAVGGVDAGGHEDAADAALDDFLLDEPHRRVGLAEEPIGGEDVEDLRGVARQEGAEPIEPGAAALAAADGDVDADMLAGDEDALAEGGLQERADLVGDAVLALGGVAGVDGAGALGPRAGEAVVELGDQRVELAFGPGQGLLSLLRGGGEGAIDLGRGLVLHVASWRSLRVIGVPARRGDRPRGPVARSHVDGLA
jgi:hypothetical protein